MAVELLTYVSVFTAGGFVVAIVEKTLAAKRRADETYVAQTHCRETHERVDADLVQRQQRTHDLRNDLAVLSNRVAVLDKRLTELAADLRWVMSSLDSVMRKLGANGVPQPPQRTGTDG